MTTELAPGITHTQGAVWACNCISIVRGGDAIVVDACWSRADIEDVRDRVGDRDTHLVITHADVDHVCAVGLMPRATVVASPATAARIADGSAARELRAEAAAWELDLPADLRVDRVVETDASIELGPFSVATVDARGHSVDGTGYVFREHGIFAVGDYLMKSQYPIVWWSAVETLESTHRLLAAIDRFDLEWVVPGHGPVLSVSEARQVGAEDIDYLERVAAVADAALRDGLGPGEWSEAVQNVEVPRPGRPDIEQLCPRLSLAEATFRDRGR